MKKATDLILSSLNKRKPRSCCSLDRWCRQISSLRGAAERREFASSLLVPSRRAAVREKALADPWGWSEKKHPNHLALATKEALLLHPQTVEGRLEKSVACRPSYQQRFEHEKYGRSAIHEGTCSKICRDGELGEAVKALDLLVQPGTYVSTSLFYRVLKRCTLQKDLVLGRHVHALAIKSGYERDTFLANHLICMYASNGMLEEATQVFTKVDAPDAYMWASIILAHARHGQPTQGIKLYRQMRRSTMKPDSTIYLATLKACASAADLSSGKEVHANILESEVEFNMFVGNCLVDMYAKCGSLMDAHKVFDSLPTRDAVTWNSMIAGYVQHGLGKQALSLYARMQEEGMTLATNVTFVSLLQACSSMRALHQGQQLHAQIQETGLEGDVVVGSCLVDMYAKCGNLVDARIVFDRLPTKNVVTWTAMIAGYAEHGLSQEAFALYATMQVQDIAPNHFTFSCLLKACARVEGLQQGKQLHAEIEARGLDVDTVVGNSLVDMYSKCASLEDALRVFDHLQTKDVVTWNSLLAGYVQHGLSQEALTLYARMQAEGITPPDHVTFVCLLQSCASIGDLHQGKQLHAEIQERGLDSDVVVANSLIDMYAKCGSLLDALKVFEKMHTRDVVTWNSMIGAYAHHKHCQEALRLYSDMQREGVNQANDTTFVCLLKACASVRALQEGEQVHAQIQEQGLEDDVVVGSCLVNMYAKCGSLVDARRVFDRLRVKDVVTWTTMITGYCDQGLGQEALHLYSGMQQEGITPADHVTFACLLKACSSLGAWHQGKQLHAQIQERGLEGDVLVGNCLVDMYAKCGNLVDARRVFDILPTRDVVTWTALLNGYAQHSDGQMAVQCFEKMLRQGVEPDAASFVPVLVACCHEGLVTEGRRYFKMMEELEVVPSVSHYNCMVDLLGRSGLLDEAENMLVSVPFENNVVGWTSLLSACKSHSDIDRGKQCFDRLIALEPENGSAYALLSSMYASAGRWGDAHEIEGLRKSAGAMKKPAKACIELEKTVHEFIVGEQRADITAKLRSVNLRLEEGGHMPHTELVLKAVSDREKADALCGHAEKLALAYGLLNTPDGTTLLVTKNLRMCHDCHSGTKIMSRLEKREIIVKDAHRVHRFVDGSCSCGDGH